MHKALPRDEMHSPKKRKALAPRPINEKLCFITYISSKYT